MQRYHDALRAGTIASLILIALYLAARLFADIEMPNAPEGPQTVQQASQ